MLYYIPSSFSITKVQSHIFDATLLRIAREPALDWTRVRIEALIAWFCRWVGRWGFEPGLVPWSERRDWLLPLLPDLLPAGVQEGGGGGARWSLLWLPQHLHVVLSVLMGSGDVCLQTALRFRRKITFATLELFTNLVRLWPWWAGGGIHSSLL